MIKLSFQTKEIVVEEIVKSVETEYISNLDIKDLIKLELLTPMEMSFLYKKYCEQNKEEEIYKLLPVATNRCLGCDKKGSKLEKKIQYGTCQGFKTSGISKLCEQSKIAVPTWVREQKGNYISNWAEIDNGIYLPITTTENKNLGYIFSKSKWKEKLGIIVCEYHEHLGMIFKKTEDKPFHNLNGFVRVSNSNNKKKKNNGKDSNKNNNYSNDKLKKGKINKNKNSKKIKIDEETYKAGKL
jgi:hypothetical protein